MVFSGWFCILPDIWFLRGEHTMGAFSHFESYDSFSFFPLFSLSHLISYITSLFVQGLSNHNTFHQFSLILKFHHFILSLGSTYSTSLSEPTFTYWFFTMFFTAPISCFQFYSQNIFLKYSSSKFLICYLTYALLCTFTFTWVLSGRSPDSKIQNSLCKTKISKLSTLFFFKVMWILHYEKKY